MASEPKPLKDMTIEELRVQRDAELDRIYDAKKGKPPLTPAQKEIDRRILTDMLSW